MSQKNQLNGLRIAGADPCAGCCSGPQPADGVSRRWFLQAAGAAGMAIGGLTLAAGETRAAAEPVEASEPFPRGKPLRVLPILVYDHPTHQEQASWRGYGAIQTPEAAKEEAARIEKELAQLKAIADFPLELQPVRLLESQAGLAELGVDQVDLCVLYAAGSCTQWPLKVPMVMFVRHRSGPFYLGFEIAHWRFLRQSGDVPALDGFDTDDVIVDNCDELLWRFRAMYGLQNARNTKMLTIGGLAAYSKEAQENGPRVAKEVWGYEFVDIADEEFARRLQAARSDPKVARQAEEQTAALLAVKNVMLETDRKFVYNSFMALHVCRQLLEETGATNFGFSKCMGHAQMAILETTACLVLSLANDEGYTAYCHTDLSHTMPGVLLRWIASRPTFVCNSHVPYNGLFFVAHCQAPRRMNGRDYEPATIMTHYESDYGAACKTHYTKGQQVTVVVPNLRCTRWQAFRGSVVGAPSYPACRSQMEIAIDGRWQQLVREMEGFHAQVVYGDYTRELGYALKKLGGQIRWDCYSDPEELE
ncbi:MAG: hypothetical protein ACYC6Y_18935 [Thermoguttaceae bacterium]